MLGLRLRKANPQLHRLVRKMIERNEFEASYAAHEVFPWAQFEGELDLATMYPRWYSPFFKLATLLEFIITYLLAKRYGMVYEMCDNDGREYWTLQSPYYLRRDL